MIRFKNHRRAGFTLVETILAVTIAGMVLTPIFILHGSLLKRVNRGAQAFNALLFGKQLLYEARQMQEPQAQVFALEKKDEHSDTKADYSLQQRLDGRSPFATLEGLHKETVTITWTENGQVKREQLITFMYKTAEQKKQ